MRNGNNTQIEKKGILNKWTAVVVFALLGLAATPVVFRCAFHYAAIFTMWGYGEDPDDGLFFFLPAMGAIFFGAAWSIITFFLRKRWNVVLLLVLMAVVWAFVLGVTVAYGIRCVIVSF